MRLRGKKWFPGRGIMIVGFDLESKLRLYEILSSKRTTEAVGTLPRFRRCLGKISFSVAW